VRDCQKKATDVSLKGISSRESLQILLISRRNLHFSSRRFLLQHLHFEKKSSLFPEKISFLTRSSHLGEKNSSRNFFSVKSSFFPHWTYRKIATDSTRIATAITAMVVVLTTDDDAERLELCGFNFVRIIVWCSKPSAIQSPRVRAHCSRTNPGRSADYTDSRGTSWWKGVCRFPWWQFTSWRNTDGRGSIHVRVRRETRRRSARLEIV
jgi:hypothetical protein